MMMMMRGTGLLLLLLMAKQQTLPHIATHRFRHSEPGRFRQPIQLIPIRIAAQQFLKFLHRRRHPKDEWI
jgi:hypothetical protein